MTRKVLLAALLLGTTGCNFWYNEVPSPDDLMHAIPWFDHMITSKAVHPYASDSVPRNTPAGIVPIGGAEADWRQGDPTAAFPTYGFDTLVANAVKRPTLAASPTARSGEELFRTYCSMCHGMKGDGDGTMKSYTAPPSLLQDHIKARSEGWIYSMIRYGRGSMPQYGDKIVRVDERWAVVDYVRSLQGVAQAAPAGGAQ